MADLSINFRATSGYVTDLGIETYDLGVVYPVTRGGFTFGWSLDNTANARDRNAGIDRRLAGLNQRANTTNPNESWRLDLPATGSYTVEAALGDASNTQTEFVVVSDNTTTKKTISNVDLASGSFLDESGVSRTTANWPTLNVAETYSFASTILKFLIGDPAFAAGSSTCIAHIRAYSAFIARPLVRHPVAVQRAAFY